MTRFPFFQQLDQMDCGPTCLRMIARHHGRVYSRDFLREKCSITREGVSLGGISDAAEAIGMNTLGVSVTFQSLRDEIPLPCIAHWRQRHFIVVYGVEKDTVHVADLHIREGQVTAIVGASGSGKDHAAQAAAQVENLQDFYSGRTVMVIAHRLTTVRNADQIIVLDRGHIVESGAHEELARTRGAYFTLVKNQLELGT